MVLKEKIHPDRIDDINSEDVPNQELDPLLHQTISSNMIHGPCGELNPSFPCTKEGKCSKIYLRELEAETQTDYDGYPKCRRRSPEHGGNVNIINVKNIDVEVDNRWVVPYTPLHSKLFQAHINVEFCNSMKSMKYIFKYVNKGSDML